MISDVNGAVFKFSGLKNNEGLTEYVQDGLNSQGEPELDSCSDDMSMVGTSPRIGELVRSSNRGTPSVSSDGSNDTIETFGELILDDVYDDMVSVGGYVQL